MIEQFNFDIRLIFAILNGKVSAAINRKLYRNFRQKKSTGFYQLIEFNAEPTVIDKLELNFRRDERVIRFLTFRMDKYAAEYAAKRRSVKSNKKED